MYATLEALHRLQALELKLAAIRQSKESRTRRIQAHQRQLKMADEQLQESQRTVRERQVRMDALALDAAAREESINKHRELLNRAKTNKEYAAILAAMNTAKADNAKLESNILQLMDEIQSLQNRATELEQQKLKLFENVEAAQKVLRAYEIESQQECDRLQMSRDESSADIAPTTLATFNRVAGHHDGEALAAVQKLHPKREEFACSGCNMKVTLEVLNVLQTRDELQLCDICGRILYIEEPRAQPSSA